MKDNVPDDYTSSTEDEPAINIDDAPTIVEDTSQFLSEPNRHITLSSMEEAELFFLDGKYAIDFPSKLEYDIDNTAGLESAIENISAYISDLRLNSKDANFDDQAPLSICQIIAYASALETNISTSEDLDEVIDTRRYVWNEGYRKYSIAWNLANNMQEYALQYLDIGGDYNTIKYYYYCSIDWCWKALNFKEIDEKTIIKTIGYIKMRYHDIMFVAPNNSDDKLRAEIIYSALSTIENRM